MGIIKAEKREQCQIIVGLGMHYTAVSFSTAIIQKRVASTFIDFFPNMTVPNQGSICAIMLF